MTTDSQARTRWLAAAIVGVALAVRVALVIHIYRSYHPVTDSSQFDFIANSLASGHGYGHALNAPAVGPSSFRAPFYPLALAAVYLIGHHPTLGLLEEAVFGTVVVALLGVVTAQLFTVRVALIAMAIAAVDPALLLFGSSLQLEPLLAVLLLGGLAVTLHYRDHDWAAWPWIAGLCLGLAMLTREIAAGVILPVAWLLATSGGRRRFRWQPVAALAAAIVLTLVPWTIRNEVRLHTFAPTSTSAGYTLAGTYNATANANKSSPAVWTVPYQDPTLYKLLLSKPHPSEAWVNHVLTTAAIDYVKAHPTYVFKVVAWNSVRLFDLRGTEDALYIAPYIPYPHNLTVLAVFASYPIELLALASLLLPAVRRLPPAVLVMPLLLWLAIVVLNGNIRYRSSIEPFSVMLAAAAIAWALERVRPSREAV